MSTAVSVGKGGTTGVFLRKATGLVREVSLIDALIMNTLGMNVAIGAVFLFLQAPANFPHGSMFWAVVIGTVLMAFTLLWVYSEFAAAMPRSGGDYVFVSRALHPFLGWLLSWSQGAWLIFFWVGFNFLLFKGGDLSANWDSFVKASGGLRFDQIIPTARSAGFSGTGGFSLKDTILMLPWVFFVVGYAQGSAQIGGEVKRAARNQYLAMVGGVLLNGLMLALLVIVFTQAVGVNWIGSVGFLSSTNPGLIKLPGNFSPSFNFIVSLLTGNVLIPL